MYTKILFVSILFLLAVTACRQNSTSNAPNQTTKSAVTTSPQVSRTPAPTPSANSNSTPEVQAKYYNGTGKVTKINMEIGSVELDHEEIKGLMPKMIMEFYVADKSELEDLKIGDQVKFVLEDKAGAERISSIKKAGKDKSKK